MTISEDGRYITLSDLKLYGLGAIADPNNPTVYNSAVQGTPDDSVLSQCIQRAEMEFDRIAGIAFDKITSSTVQAFLPFVDGNGWLTMFAREHAPVTSVTSVSLFDMQGNKTWTAVTFDSDKIIYPVNDGYAHPDCAQVKLYPATAMMPRGTGQIMVKWTYVGGFTTIPQSLKAIVVRLAWWLYKIREAPLTQITMPQLGVMQIPMKIPPDVYADILLWQPSYN